MAPRPSAPVSAPARASSARSRAAEVEFALLTLATLAGLAQGLWGLVAG